MVKTDDFLKILPPIFPPGPFPQTLVGAVIAHVKNFAFNGDYTNNAKTSKLSPLKEGMGQFPLLQFFAPFLMPFPVKEKDEKKTKQISDTKKTGILLYKVVKLMIF